MDRKMLNAKKILINAMYSAIGRKTGKEMYDILKKKTDEIENAEKKGEVDWR